MRFDRLSRALKAHWPEYLIEAWALGAFMVSAACFGVLLESSASPVPDALESDGVRRALGGLAMGLTAVGLIYSPWGKRSGAHMNPAVTLAFLRLKRIDGADATFYIAAQFIGGSLGVLAALAFFGDELAAPPVAFVATTPTRGAVAAFAGEFLISYLMMTTVLWAADSTRFMPYTGAFAGTLVALFIAVEAPYSGMSMNPARTFASAIVGGGWSGFWIYVLAPVAAMQLAVAVHSALLGARPGGCAKLVHARDQRCIHCGYEPTHPSRIDSAVSERAAS